MRDSVISPSACINTIAKEQCYRYIESSIIITRFIFTLFLTLAFISGADLPHPCQLSFSLSDPLGPIYIFGLFCINTHLM